jgi:molybdate transport system substrate-binding protein
MKLLLAALLAGPALLAMSVTHAAEIKVLTAGAYKPVVATLAPGFEQRTGHKVLIDSGTAGQLTKRIADGESFDLAVITPAAIKQLADAGKVRGDTAAPVARVGIGVAVKSGAPFPDISSVAAFQKALLSARAIAYSDPAAGGSSGIYLDKLFDKMGIATQVRAKAVLVPGGLVAQRLETGEADIAIHQISEILPVTGATLVGPLPPEIQNFTVYTAAVSSNSPNAAAAAEFLSLWRGAEAAMVLKAKGMEPVAP